MNLTESKINIKSSGLSGASSLSETVGLTWAISRFIRKVIILLVPDNEGG